MIFLFYIQVKSYPKLNFKLSWLKNKIINLGYQIFFKQIFYHFSYINQILNLFRPYLFMIGLFHNSELIKKMLDFAKILMFVEKKIMKFYEIKIYQIDYCLDEFKETIHFMILYFYLSYLLFQNPRLNIQPKIQSLNFLDYLRTCLMQNRNQLHLIFIFFLINLLPIDNFNSLLILLI